jgi:hypothetical protein
MFGYDELKHARRQLELLVSPWFTHPHYLLSSSRKPFFKGFPLHLKVRGLRKESYKVVV